MRALLAFSLVLLVGCGQEDVLEFEEPQIVPQSNVLCLAYEELVAGTRSAHFVQLTNRGRDPLIIRGAVVEEDARGAFTVDRVRTASGVDCTEAQPCSVPSTEDAILRFLYAPPAPGWDTADLRVLSNAQNYPRLRLFVLARARPMGLDAGTPYDAGPRPPNAVGADGTPTCP
jgi:hypothetical protein